MNKISKCVSTRRTDIFFSLKEKHEIILEYVRVKYFNIHKFLSNCSEKKRILVPVKGTQVFIVHFFQFSI